MTYKKYLEVTHCAPRGVYPQGRWHVTLCCDKTLSLEIVAIAEDLESALAKARKIADERKLDFALHENGMRTWERYRTDAEKDLERMLAEQARVIRALQQRDEESDKRAREQAEKIAELRREIERLEQFDPDAQNVQRHYECVRYLISRIPKLSTSALKECVLFSQDLLAACRAELGRREITQPQSKGEAE